MVGETFNATSDNSIDYFDFSALSSAGIRLDLSSTAAQSQPSSSLKIQLSDGMGIENVIGSRGADTIVGNTRSNYIGGEEYFEYTLSPQWPVAVKLSGFI